ncbi:MAG: reverse transcriptase domain-containing protein, partial [Bacteroidota bacterium]
CTIRWENGTEEIMKDKYLMSAVDKIINDDGLPLEETLLPDQPKADNPTQAHSFRLIEQESGGKREKGKPHENKAEEEENESHEMESHNIEEDSEEEFPDLPQEAYSENAHSSPGDQESQPASEEEEEKGKEKEENEKASERPQRKSKTKAIQLLRKALGRLGCEEANLCEEEKQNNSSRARKKRKTYHSAESSEIRKQKERVKTAVEDDDSEIREWCYLSVGPEPVVNRDEPASYREAEQSQEWPLWKKGIDDEITNIFENGVAQEVPVRDVPRGSEVIPTKWVFKKKFDTLGKFEKVRCRLVALGNCQRVTPENTYSPTLGYPSVRLLMAIAVHHDLKCETSDVSCAFLQAEFDETQTIYLIPPNGIANKDRIRWKLYKSIYGLATAPAMWYKTFADTLESLAFKSCVSDNTILSMAAEWTILSLLHT